MVKAKRGQKVCPKCQKICGCRSRECPECHHMFEASVKTTVSTSIKKPKDKPVNPDAVIARHEKIHILIPAGPPLVEPEGYKKGEEYNATDNQVLDWLHRMIAKGHERGLLLSVGAIK